MNCALHIYPNFDILTFQALFRLKRADYQKEILNKEYVCSNPIREYQESN